MSHISIMTWNIQGEKNITGYTFPKKIRPHLANATADIIALQECCRPELLCNGTDILKNYTLLASKKNADKSGFPYLYNDNVILTKHPVLDFHDMPFPDLGQLRPLENVLRADINVNGTVVRIYNCHFPVFRAGPRLRVKLLEYLLTDAKGYDGPVVICGDLNTTVPKPGWGRALVRAWHQKPRHELVIDGTHLTTDERELIHNTITKHGFTEALDINLPTWSPLKSDIWEPGKLKLDWLLVSGLAVAEAKLGNYVSDHRPVEARLKFI